MSGSRTSAEHQHDDPLPVPRRLDGRVTVLRTRRLPAGQPDGSYFGRLIPDEPHPDESISGAVFGPTGIYPADILKPIRWAQATYHIGCGGASQSSW